MRFERDQAVPRAYARDAAGLELVPEGGARPAVAAEVAALMRETAATRTAVTPAGCNSGASGTRMCSDDDGK